MASSHETGAPDPATAQDGLKRLLSMRPLLLAYLAGMVRDFAFAEDIFQDLCVQVTQRWDQFAALPDDQRRFTKWTRELARDRTFALLRARARHDSASATPPEELINRMEAAIARWQDGPTERWTLRKEALRACLKRLPEHLRRVVGLRYAKNFSVAAIAKELGKDRDEIIAALKQARAEIDVCLRKRLDEGLATAEGSA